MIIPGLITPISDSLHTVPGQGRVLSRERLRKQATSRQTFGSVPHRTCLIAYRLGLHLPLVRLPRLRGLLTPCTSKRHCLRLLFSFRPSPQTGSYYGLC